MAMTSPQEGFLFKRLCRARSQCALEPFEVWATHFECGRRGRLEPLNGVFRPPRPPRQPMALPPRQPVAPPLVLELSGG